MIKEEGRKTKEEEEEEGGRRVKEYREGKEMYGEREIRKKEDLK